MEAKRCPICGNPSIPDYQNKDVVCPQCGSDLKIYHTLAEVGAKEGNSARGWYKRFIISCSIIPLTFCVFFYFYEDIKGKYGYIKEKMSVLDREKLNLEYSVKILKDSINALKTSIEITHEETDYEYTVVKNDGGWKIIKNLFGNTENWNMKWEEIAKYNNLWDEKGDTSKMIHPGQKLRISITK